jgi:hypothetical protein
MNTHTNSLTKRIIKDKKGVFGLTSVQQFFAIILGVALLAYVIVVIAGVLVNSNIIPPITSTTVNESGLVNTSGYQLATYATPGWSGPTIITMINASNGVTMNSGNYSLTAGGLLTNKSSAIFYANITYSYMANSPNEERANVVLNTTAQGITSFFVAINPVYAILAILVIILAHLLNFQAWMLVLL